MTTATLERTGYARPSINWNGLTVTDLFCGAGIARGRRIEEVNFLDRDLVMHHIDGTTNPVIDSRYRVAA
jgi:hypothetical protein